jgi:outer membrane protein TolC
MKHRKQSQSLMSHTLKSVIFYSMLQFPQSAFSGERIQLDHFLNQVKANHGGVKSSLVGTQAGQLRSEEGDLILSPTAFAEFKYVSDAKYPQTAFLNYDNIVTKTLAVGVKKQTSFGLNASLSYNLLSTYYNNPISLFNLGGAGASGSSNLILTSYALAYPMLELRQSIWGNGFGRSTRAQVSQATASALASSYQNSYQAKSIVMNAELAYWRLALARQVVQVQKEALDRGEKTHEYNSRRARLQLGEEADVIQSEATVRARELDLKTAEAEEILAARGFNSMRSIDSDRVEEELIELKPELVSGIQIPKRATFRDDVLSAEQSAKASRSGAQVSVEKNTPTLDVYASVALNGQSGFPPYQNLSDSIPKSFQFNRPTTTVGVTFSAPLDLGSVANVRDGWRQEQDSAEMNFSRKVFDQEQNWKELVTNFEESVKQFQLSLKLEDVQKSKLANERGRLQRGRSTTYQVLLFEQDYLQAQLTRIRAEAKILNTLAQMNLFGETL